MGGNETVGARILVIDDDPVNRMLLQENIASQGHAVALAEDGLQGIELMQGGNFDLILLDLVMPRMDGYQVLEHMKSDSRLRHVPVIVISSEGEIDSIMRCIEMGATDYLPKPFNPTILHMRLNNALKSAPPLCMIEQGQASLLVVDDDEFNRMILSANLEEKGYSVTSVPCGNEALDMLLRRSFDVVFLDLVMPGMDGMEVLRRMKSDSRLEHVPVIVVSGESDTDRIAGCIEIGAADHIPKPFDPIILHARLNASLASKRLREREIAYHEVIKNERLKAEYLLLNVLPKPIADRLKNGEENIADSFDEVTVLFADIVGFTQLSTKMPPHELVSLLNDIFSAFDQLAENRGVEKIKTIGDAYMAVGGLPLPHPDHAEAVASLGLDMIRAVEKISTARGTSLSIRVGLHSGPVVAGVIGSRKFTYDLWGDTVNIASRMESHGVPDSIHVSHSTFELLKTKFEFLERGVVAIKGKGEMKTYLMKC